MKHSLILSICLLFIPNTTFTAAPPPESIANDTHHLRVQCRHKHNQQTHRFFIGDKAENNNRGIMCAIAVIKTTNKEYTLSRKDRKKVFSQEEIKSDNLYGIIVDFWNN